MSLCLVVELQCPQCTLLQSGRLRGCSHSAVYGERCLSVGDVEQASWEAGKALDDLRSTERDDATFFQPVAHWPVRRQDVAGVLWPSPTTAKAVDQSGCECCMMLAETRSLLRLAGVGLPLPCRFYKWLQREPDLFGGVCDVTQCRTDGVIL